MHEDNVSYDIEYVKWHIEVDEQVKVQVFTDDRVSIVRCLYRGQYDPHYWQEVKNDEGYVYKVVQLSALYL